MSASAEVRAAMSEFIRKNSLDIERLMTSSSPITRTVTSVEERTPDFGALVGTQKEKASIREKKLLLKARHQRNFARILQNKSNLPETIREPKGTLEPVAKSNVEVAQNLNDLKKPVGVYDNIRFFCDCAGCVAHRETQLKADKWWLAGDKERALGYKDKACLNTLPIGYNSVIKRKYRPRLPKKPNHTPALCKKLNKEAPEKVAPSDHHKAKGIQRHGTIDIDEYDTIDRAIEETEERIRRMVGSADWTAEVIVIITSLAASRVAYQESYRLLRFFEAKGVDHIAIDVNADIGVDSIDYPLLRTWNAENLLLKDSNKLADGVALPVIVPQVLIDGVPIGPLEEILTLEDENDLDHVLAREACPNCLANRKPSEPHCRRCCAMFRDLISTRYLSSDSIRILIMRSAKNACRIKAPTPYDWEKRRRQLGLKSKDEDASTWFKPADLRKFGIPSLGFCVTFD